MELALNDCGSPLGVYEIARRQRIPERFLEQIFGELRRAKILESHRGAHVRVHYFPGVHAPEPETYGSTYV